MVHVGTVVTCPLWDDGPSATHNEPRRSSRAEHHAAPNLREASTGRDGVIDNEAREERGEASEIQYSIIIAMYNAGDEIACQLAALAGQRCPVPWEVIVADNGSTDDSPAIAAEWGGRIPHFSLIDASRRQGKSFARNEGARHARGRFLFFVDADDVVADGWLEAMHEAVDGGAVHVGGALDNVTLLDDSPLQPQVEHLTEPPSVLEFLPYAVGCNNGTRRDIFEELGGWDERFDRGEDVAFSWKAKVNGYDLTFVRDAVLHYRLRGTLRGLLEQQFGNGFVIPQLLREFRPFGAQREPIPRTLRRITMLVVALPTLALSAPNRWHWLRSVAFLAGRWAGSVRWRTFCP